MSSPAVTSSRAGLRSRQAGTLTKLLGAGDVELRAVGHEALTIRTVATRAGVSPATAYAYLASKNHLFAELFLGHLADDEFHEPVGPTATARVQSVTRRMSDQLAAVPELAAAVTPALLSSAPDVAQLRVRIGAVFVRRFEDALGDQRTPALVDALTFAFSGALLQAGMGVITYAELGARLDTVVDTILAGHV